MPASWLDEVAGSFAEPASDSPAQQAPAASTEGNWLDEVASSFTPPQAAPAPTQDPRALQFHHAPSLIRAQPQGRLSSAGGSFMRGFGDIIASLPKAVGEGAVQLANKFGDDPLWGNPDNITPEQTTAWKAGDAINKWFNKFAVNPAYRDEFWASDVANGAGTMVGFGLGGLAGKVAKIPALATTMGLGATATGVEGVNDYLATLEKGEKVDPKLREQSFNWNAALGTSEALPISHLLNRLDKVTGGGVKKILTEGFKGGLEEFSQEVIQSVGQNAVAKDIVAYDPDRGYFTGTARAGEVGFTLGFALNTLAAMVGSRRAGHSGAPPPSAESEDTGEPTIGPVGQTGIDGEIPPDRSPLNAMDILGEEESTVAEGVATIQAGAPASSGTQSSVGATPGVGAGVLPENEQVVAPEAVPEPKIEYFDDRLKQDRYRGWLGQLADELTPGGDISLVPDPNYIGGESDKRNDDGSYEAPMIRTPSINPEWFQSLVAQPDYQMSVEGAIKAVEKANNGDRLGVRQQRVVEAMLNMLTGERQDQLPQARAALQAARDARAASGLPDAPDWLFEEEDYPEDADGLTRTFMELSETAHNLSPELGARVDDLRGSRIDDATILAAITKVIGDYKNGRQSDSGQQGNQEPQAQAGVPDTGLEPVPGELATAGEPAGGPAGDRYVEPRPTAEPAVDQSQGTAALDRVWDEYDNQGIIQDTELVDEVEALIADGAAPESLQQAVDTYRQEQADDRELGGRGDMDAAFADFLEAFDAVRSGMDDAPATPAPVKATEPATTDRRQKKKPGLKQERRLPGDAEKRRRNWAYRKEIDAMEPKEKDAVINQLRNDALINKMSGLGSRMAWEDIEKKAAIAAIDADSLKYVNDKLGNKAGDELLVEIGKALKAQFGGDAFHVSGDEYWVHGINPTTLGVALRDVQAILKRKSATGPGGTITGLGFSYGIADSEDAADRLMKADKQTRTDEGLRVERGERPEGVVLNGEEEAPAAEKPEELTTRPVPGHAAAFGYSFEDSNQHPKSPSWKLDQQEDITVSKNKHGVPTEHALLGTGKNEKWGFAYSWSEKDGGSGYGLFTKFTKAYDTREEAITALLEKIDGDAPQIVTDRFKKALQGAATGKNISKKEQLFAEYDGKRFPVDSLEDASNKASKFIDESGAGASAMGGFPVSIVDQNGKQVAVISYNGRVWDKPGNGRKEIKIGNRPTSEEQFGPGGKYGPKAPGKSLDSIMITESYQVEETGEIVEVESSASELLKASDDRISALEQLKECIKS